MMRVFDEPAFILHSRPYKETSLLAEVFTLNYGVVSIMVKGALRPKSQYKSIIQPLRPLLLSWQGRTGLKILTGAEPAQNIDLATGQLIQVSSTLFTADASGVQYYCALYINELATYLLPKQESHPLVFAAYLNCLSRLFRNDAGTESALEHALRYYESVLLDELGYGINFRYDISGKPINPEHCYVLQGGEGFVYARNSVPQRVFSGRDILDIGSGNYDLAGARKAAKLIFRQLLDIQLGGRRLHSRELIRYQIRTP
ncbi:DNA repair protein RecO [Oleiphilus messinensis]|uniref:DNA repair protein RecO n=1 Tax=Oleiphilus messinensis TaxID=141451 RepID=A0A1Y0I517_9GAMM|nr:DNA repair protein RecO [Oleiphilus messinensis]ARU55330.1 DNA repair protein RecO [Oleiphilus messinensis]